MIRLTVAALVLSAAGVLVPSAAHAHFILQTPASWAAQDDFGGPQKSPPCGQSDPGQAASPTGMVTPLTPGQTVTITINETIAHPGHYRVVLSESGQAGLPADPPVTPVGADPCGSTVIQNPPVYPVLADGMLTHTSAFSVPQSFTVTIPTNVTCTNCTLQVVEFMSNHGAPCFYHHCANVTIQAGGGTGGTGGPGGSSGAGGRGGTTGAGGSADAGTGEGGGSSSGCGCALGDARISLGAVLLVLAVLARRRFRGR
jgi:hypothetical protein